jgi:hypothetical protein
MGEPVDYTLRVSFYDIAGKFRDHIAVSEDKQLVGIFDSVQGGAGEFYEQHTEECFDRCFNLVVEYAAEYKDEVLSDVDIIKKLLAAYAIDCSAMLTMMTTLVTLKMDPTSAQFTSTALQGCQRPIPSTTSVVTLVVPVQCSAGMEKLCSCPIRSGRPGKY